MFIYQSIAFLVLRIGNRKATSKFSKVVHTYFYNILVSNTIIKCIIHLSNNDEYQHYGSRHFDSHFFCTAFVLRIISNIILYSIQLEVFCELVSWTNKDKIWSYDDHNPIICTVNYLNRSFFDTLHLYCKWLATSLIHHSIIKQIGCMYYD